MSSRDNRLSQNQDKDDDSSDDEKMVICDTAPKSQEKGNIAFEELKAGILYPPPPPPPLPGRSVASI